MSAYGTHRPKAGIVDEDDRSLGATTRPHSNGPRRIERRKRGTDRLRRNTYSKSKRIHTTPSPMPIVRYRNRNPEYDFQKKKKGRKRVCSRKNKTVCFDDEIPKWVELEREFNLKRNATGKTVRRPS